MPPQYSKPSRRDRRTQKLHRGDGELMEKGGDGQVRSIEVFRDKGAVETVILYNKTCFVFAADGKDHLMVF